MHSESCEIKWIIEFSRELELELEFSLVLFCYAWALTGALALELALWQDLIRLSRTLRCVMGPLVCAVS